VKLAAPHLRQRDGVSCGPAVAVMAGAIVDPAYGAEMARVGRAGTDWEQGRVHRAANRIWPRGLGTTPRGIARAISAHSSLRGVRYGWRLLPGRRAALADVERAVALDWPVAMLVGGLIPRHWVLVVDVVGDAWHCYEPSSGEVRPVTRAAVRDARCTGLGFPRAFAVVLPRGRIHSNI
jgi:hypothetical protein